jgi:tRNA modification GTPase
VSNNTLNAECSTFAPKLLQQIMLLSVQFAPTIFCANNMNPQSTIAAIATPAGAGAVAIVRMSGAMAATIADAVFTCANGKKLANQEPRTLRYGRIVHRDVVLDEAMAVVFRAPHSYTGEDSVEIYCHGSVFVQQQILQALIDNGATMAQPGEFTMRAFLNQKIDLAQAEAIGHLISARTTAAHRIAMNQMGGGYSQQIKHIRSQMLNVAALLELELDFSEEDLDFVDRNKISGLIAEINAHIEPLIASFAAGNAIKMGVHTAICGRPNAGKSALFNALLQDQRALVSPIAGTTRDSIEATSVLDGIMFRFVDTAGLRHTTDLLENMGIERSRKNIERADIILWIADCTAMPADIVDDIRAIADEENNSGKKFFLLLNKTDLLADTDIKVMTDSIKMLADSKDNAITLLPISVKSGYGLQDLRRHLVEAASLPEWEDSNSIVCSLRHYDALVRTRAAMRTAQEAAQNAIAAHMNSELIAYELRCAATALGEITGEITSEDTLNHIFGQFCIGK